MTVDLDPISATNQSFANINSIPHDTAPGLWDGMRREGGYFLWPTAYIMCNGPLSSDTTHVVSLPHIEAKLILTLQKKY